MNYREIPSAFRESRPADYGLENALAAYVRKRWSANHIENVMAEWGLSRGRAQNVVYAHGSLASLNAIVRHKRGGLRLLLHLGCVMTGETIHHLIRQDIEAADHALQKSSQEADSLRGIESRLADSALGFLGLRRNPDGNPRPNGVASSGLSSPSPMGGV